MNSSSEPLFYKNGVVKFKGKELKDSRLLGLRGNWVNELGFSDYHNQWLIVFDDYIVLGDQVREHHSRHRSDLIDKMSEVVFLGTTYNDPVEILNSDVRVTVNGVQWRDVDTLCAVKNMLLTELEERFNDQI